MPSLSTPLSSSGSQESDGENNSPLMMAGYFGDEAQELDSTGGEEDPAPASITSDILDDEDSGDDVNQILNELPRNPTVAPPPEQQGVKRKRGRPTKAEAKAKNESASKAENNSHRRSGRIVAQAKSETAKATVQSTGGGRPKRGTASEAFKASQQKGKKSASAGKAGRAAREKEWDVESIVAVRTDAATMQEEYFVKWKGYSAKDNTWEPKENLKNCQGALDKFEANKKKTTRERPSKKIKTTKVK